MKIEDIHYIPIGDSAYSYKLLTEEESKYYLKVSDLRTMVGRRTAEHMKFSLPLQRFISEHASAVLSAPVPQYTMQKDLSAVSASFLFALYTFIEGSTLSNAYPMSSSLVQRIGQALATLHQLQIPEALRQQSPEDNLLAAIDSHLLADLDAVAGITVREAEYLQRLRELIQPRQAYIRAFMARSRQYRDEIQQISLPTVVCHGDAWGGNIIPTASGQFVLLDWESSVVAPAERDAYNYIGFNGDNFAAFTTGYHSVRKEPFRWNSHRLAYYSYSHQLRNLATWLHNLLHEAYNAEQHAHDLEMIEYHCLNRLENVEHAVDRLVKTMKELPTSTFPLLQQDC